MYHLPVVRWESDSDDEELVVEIVPREAYRMFQRFNIDWISDEAFIYRFRLSKGTVLQVLQMIEPRLAFNSQRYSILFNFFLPFSSIENFCLIVCRSRHISPLNRLLIALRFYASGSFQVVVSDFIGCCRSTVCVILPQVSGAIAQLRPQFINMPATADEMRDASMAFYHFAKFPSVIGAIDCTHIKIQSPGGNQSELFRNRKGHS